ncbi:MAG: M61 family metallopeptidase [Planctomycetota bacterium]
MPTNQKLRYGLAVEDPVRRYLALSLSIPAGPAGPVVLRMPAWTPGSYVIREYARHVERVAARGRGGRTLKVRRLSKDRWEVVREAKERVDVSWSVYGNELSVRTNHVDDTHAFVQPTATFLWPEGMVADPVVVDVTAPKGWTEDCSLPRARGGAKDGVRLVAPNQETLHDSPIHLGLLRSFPFTVRGIPHELSLWGEGNEDPAGMVKSLKAMIGAGARMFGGLPYDRYVVHGLLADSGGGGLEHREGFVFQMPRWRFQPKEDANRVLTLLSHEFFHAWNVRRIRPAGHLPYDLTEEKYSRLLWQFEGLTSYYAVVLLNQAKLWDRSEALKHWGSRITMMRGVPGRRVMPLGESSLSTWVKLYKPDENTANSYVSYYLKGELAGLALDLHIRAATRGRKSYDDVMRLMWERHGATDEPVPEDGMPDLIREATGVDARRLHRRLLNETKDPDWKRLLAPFGLEMVSAPAAPPAGYKGGAWLGVATTDNGGRSKIRSVRDDGAAAGYLAAGDELVALDGWRVQKETLPARLAERKPGDTARFTVLRGDRLHEVDVPLGKPPSETTTLKTVAKPTAAQKRLLSGWLS